MISLPGTTPQPLTLRTPSSEINIPLVSQIRSQRLQLSTNNNSAAYISQLEDYLSIIIECISQEGYPHTQALTYTASIPFSDTIPWTLPTKSNKPLDTPWTLRDEISIVCCNVSMGYTQRTYELMGKFARDQKPSSAPDDKFWLNTFKLLKKGLEYTEYLKQYGTSEQQGTIWETSMEYTLFVERTLMVSIQYSFLSKCLWKLKSTEFNILDDEINYSTLARIAISVKADLISLIKDSKYHKLMAYVEYLEVILKFVNGIIGALLSIENYKQDKIGVAIGFLNMAMDNITTKTNTPDDEEAETEEESKLKKKFSSFKKKVSDKSNKIKSSKTKKFKINNNVLSKLPDGIRSDYTNLFQLIELLHYKYHLENNHLKFDTVVTQEELINYTPLGRGVPIDITPWKPNGSSITPPNTQSGYY